MDLLEAVVASAQGEQDPRCLLAVFRAVRSLVRLLAAGPPQHAARLEEVLCRSLASKSMAQRWCLPAMQRARWPCLAHAYHSRTPRLFPRHCRRSPLQHEQEAINPHDVT